VKIVSNNNKSKIVFYKKNRAIILPNEVELKGVVAFPNARKFNIAVSCDASMAKFDKSLVLNTSINVSNGNIVAILKSNDQKIIGRYIDLPVKNKQGDEYNILCKVVGIQIEGDFNNQVNYSKYKRPMIYYEDKTGLMKGRTYPESYHDEIGDFIYKKLYDKKGNKKYKYKELY
jgi:hypothetical protein